MFNNYNLIKELPEALKAEVISEDDDFVISKHCLKWQRIKIKCFHLVPILSILYDSSHSVIFVSFV